MEYMYVKDGRYYPFDNLGDDLADIRYSPYVGFEVDTLLAYPIAVLNNKGYITLQCCEVHPLNDVYYEPVDYYNNRMLSDDYDRDRMF